MEHRMCLIGECGRRAKGRGLCNKHYQYAVAHKTVEHFPLLGKLKSPETFCAVRGCGRIAIATVYCGMHYQRLWKGGNVGRPGPMKSVVRGTAEQRFWPKVEKTESCWLWKGHVARSHGYGSFWDGKRTVRVHRFAYEFLVGPIPEGMVIDHVCRTRSCVNPEHLEVVTHRENIMRGNSPMAMWLRENRQR